jgi:hypothetical protein
MFDTSNMSATDKSVYWLLMYIIADNPFESPSILKYTNEFMRLLPNRLRENDLSKYTIYRAVDNVKAALSRTSRHSQNCFVSGSTDLVATKTFKEKYKTRRHSAVLQLDLTKALFVVDIEKVITDSKVIELIWKNRDSEIFRVNSQEIKTRITDEKEVIVVYDKNVQYLDTIII